MFPSLQAQLGLTDSSVVVVGVVVSFVVSVGCFSSSQAQYGLTDSSVVVVGVVVSFVVSVVGVGVGVTTTVCIITSFWGFLEQA